MLGTYGLFGWILIGLIAGALAKLIMPGKDPGGCIVTILLGIGGALLAGSSAMPSAGTMRARRAASSLRRWARS